MWRDVSARAAEFLSDHSVMNQLFYCLSHALCLSVKERNVWFCALCVPPGSSHLSSDHLLSLGPPPASECTKALQEHPEQTAPSEKLCLVYSFLWPTLISVPITMASECLPEKKAHDKLSTHLSRVSLCLPSLSSKPFHFVSPKIRPFLEATSATVS